MLKTRSSWLNCALRDDEALYWVSIGQQWLVLGSTESLWGSSWCYWVSRGHWCLYILKKCYRCLKTERLWKLLILMRRIGALVTQLWCPVLYLSQTILLFRALCSSWFTVHCNYLPNKHIIKICYNLRLGRSGESWIGFSEGSRFHNPQLGQ